MILKYHLSNTFHRHIHLDLCSITRELNIIFGLQMVMQAVAFHVFTVQIIYECYAITVILYNDFTYEKLIDFFGIYLWIAFNTVKMIVFNYICERVCTKVYRCIYIYKNICIP